MPDPLYPIFVRLTGRRVVVVGGGTVAQFKIRGLLPSGAEVVVVSPEVLEPLRAMASEGIVEWIAREFEPADLRGAALVVAATGDREVNRQVGRAARERGLLVNAVDDPPNCDYFLPAVTRRGLLAVAVSSSGASPAFAGLLRDEIAAGLAPGLESWLRLLQEARAEVRERFPDDPRTRHRLGRELAGSPARHRAESGDIEGARVMLKEIVASATRR